MLVTRFHKMSREMPFEKMTGKLPLISPFHSLPPLPISVPSCSCYPTHHPPLSPQSFSPQSTSQHCPPLSALCCTCFLLLTSVIPFCHPTLRIFVPSSSPFPSRLSTCCPVHLAPLSCYSFIFAATPPPSFFLVPCTLVLIKTPATPNQIWRFTDNIFER